jgi:hypothetical protein
MGNSRFANTGIIVSTYSVLFRAGFVFSLITLFAVYSIISACSDKSRLLMPAFDDLQVNFIAPHDTNRVWCYYYWINDDISKEGVTRDLEAMKEFGIGGILVGNINLSAVDGSVPLFSEEWWDITVHTVNEGHRLGIDIGFFNSPGWSQSGGKWITHDKAMRYLVYSEKNISGPGRAGITLERPLLTPRITNISAITPEAHEYQDAYVLAFRTIEAEQRLLANENARITSEPAVEGLSLWLDGDPSTAGLFKISNKRYDVKIVADDPLAVRSLVLYPAQPSFYCHVDFQALVEGEYKTLASFDFDRTNPRVLVGPVTHAPYAVAIPETTASEFRLIFSGLRSNSPEAGISGIVISEALVMEEYMEKTLGKMHQTPLPDFDSYLWQTQQEPHTEGLMIEEVIDITEYMNDEGVLTWEVPEGNWTVMRVGMTPTGVTNHPAAPQGTGYEVDKMRADLIRFHFDMFLGEIIRRVPGESLPALKYAIIDSFEVGSQNWTDDFREKFIEMFGYDPVKYLPVFSGRIVGSVTESERFLWDLRRAVADIIAFSYVGGLSQISREHNMKLWLENYGHWGFPSEFLMYGGQSDMVAGEFWNEGSLGDIECKSASSAAHIYGKQRVSVEAWTASQQAYVRHPALLKRRGDWSLTEGVNHHVLHVYIHQPDDIRIPGVNAWFSTEFNRHNTWFRQGKTWVDYLRRCQHLLQQGKYVADVLYFIGEDAPKMTGARDPELPRGYSYDYVNAEVIMNRLSVKNGRLVLPDGMNYGLLVLPKISSMRPEVLSRIEELVRQGAAVLGAPPGHSPSLQGYPESDGRVRDLASRLWVSSEYSSGNLVRRHGRGYIMDGIELQKALDIIGIAKDIDTGSGVEVLWTHRTLPGMEIYFLTNQGSEPVHFEPSFRVEGLKPQLWDAVTGEIRHLNQYTEKDGRISVPMKMEALQSWFVVFSNHHGSITGKGYTENFPAPQVIKKVEGEWKVEFENKEIGPAGPQVWQELTDWTESDREMIRHYSGTATYSTSFYLDHIPAGGELYLNLGRVGVMARATVNGSDAGGAWVYPYRIPMGGLLVEGENILEVEVVNTWRNQLIRDAGLPADKRYTWVNTSDARPGEKLQTSGLTGPVEIEYFD